MADSDGTVAFSPNEAARANASIAPQADVGNVVLTPCTTLDSFVASKGIDEVALLKVDVEGYEHLVFRGARELLTGLRPHMVYFEICPALARRAGVEPGAAAELLRRSGYALFSLATGGSLLPAEPAMAAAVATYDNWIAVDPR